MSTPINFVLTDLSSSVTLSQTGNITSEVLSISGDAVAVFVAKTSDIKKVFQFQTDAVNINDVSSQDMKFYVDMSQWPNGPNSANMLVLNPANAMMDFPSYSSGAIASINKLGEPYEHNKMLVKHDFIRYIAQKMFNTYQGVDIFNNQLELSQNIEAVCDGSASGHSWFDISAALYKVSTNGSHEGLETDANGEKYMTVGTTSDANLSRELFLQIVGNQPNRLETLVLDSPDRQAIPFVTGDSINFKLTVTPAPGQETVAGLTGIATIPARTYVIKLLLVADNDTAVNTVPNDSVGQNGLSAVSYA